jgi:serine phosphatase RsbU (regulator of sigma subunit)
MYYSNNIKILLASKDNDTCLYIKNKLLGSRYNVVDLGTNGDKLINNNHLKFPDLIIIDKNSFHDQSRETELLQEMKLINVPVILYTTPTNSNLIFEQFNNRNSCGYMQIPVNEKNIHSIIDIALSNYTIDEKLKASEEEIIKKGKIEKELRSIIEESKKEMKLAGRVYRSFLPNHTPTYSNLDISYRYYPLEEVGGDYFSFINMVEGGLGVFIGDVTGHGVSAALFTSFLKSETNKICRKFGKNPDCYISELNKCLIENMKANYITCIYGYFIYDEDRDKMIFSFCNGGHPEPIILRRNGNFELVENKCPILGFKAYQYIKFNIELKRGDRLFLFTDGIVESSNNQDQMLEIHGLKKIIREACTDNPSMKATLDIIIQKAEKFRDGHPNHDDLAIIGFERMQ